MQSASEVRLQAMSESLHPLLVIYTQVHFIFSEENHREADLVIMTIPQQLFGTTISMVPIRTIC